MNSSNLTQNEILLKKQLNDLGPWMYKFQFTENITTQLALDELSEIHETRKNMIFSKLDTIYVNQWNNLNCLDIACNEGFFSFELCKRNVKKVTGFDARKINIEKANFIKTYFHYNNSHFFIDDINSIDTHKLGKYDIVFLLGLLYHIENPMLILRKVRELTKSLCIIDTQITRFNDKISMGWGLKNKFQETFDSIGLVKEKTFENNIAGSVTGLSFVPNKSALLTMLTYAGFKEFEIIKPNKESHIQYRDYDRIIIFAK